MSSPSKLNPGDPNKRPNGSGTSSASSGGSFKSAMASPNGANAPRRTFLPVPQPEKNKINLLSILKSSIGKELTKITMPVQWNEPISLLQRVSEFLNYSYLLKAASDNNDAEKRMALVATFAVSALSSNFERMGKPFNPLLGETYECEVDEFRVVAEQVCHHPPVSAFHAENKSQDFAFHGSVYPKVKFWGKSVEFQPKGVLSVEIPKYDEVYTWNNVNCVIHNIILGTLWMEQQGTLEIVNQKTKHRCVLTFRAGGWFSGTDDLHVVEGFIVDGNKKKLRFVYGKWTEFLCSVDVASLEEHLGIKCDKVDASAANMPKHEPLAMAAVPNSNVLWVVEPRPEEASKYYNFSNFTMGLNEMLPGMESVICQTDSRRRPDVRALEEGELEKAASEKERLENKQREYRKPFKGKKEHDWWSPKWFLPVKNEHTKEDDWKFMGGYWERKVASSSDIY